MYIITTTKININRLGSTVVSGRLG